MAFLQKKHFRWKEPKEFLRIQNAYEKSKARWWHRPVAGLAWFAMFIAVWLIARLDPANQPLPVYPMVPLALGAGVILAYAIPFLNQFNSSSIHLFDTFLLRMRGNSHWRLQYDQFASFSWRVREEFTTLILRRVNSADEIVIGVPRQISQEAVSQFLIDHRIPHRPSADSSSSVAAISQDRGG